MSVVACGKRPSSIFEDIPHTVSPKRIRCSVSAFSPPPSLSVSPPRSSLAPHRSDGGGWIAFPLTHLRSLFPEMDQELLERTLESSGNDIDVAVKSLTDLRLESADFNLVSSMSKSENGTGMNAQGTVMENVASPATSQPTNIVTNKVLLTNGSEWTDLFVREMMSASDLNDARTRASAALESLEKSIMACASAELMQNLHKETVMLKQQLVGLLRENAVLKRTVAIQHNRQRECEEKSQELQHLKQLVSQYQEQVRTLEMSNYALTVHLKQAQQNSSIPRNFHPDLF